MSISIAIDGVSGSGKSSLGQFLASDLQFRFFSAGKVYRAMAYCCQSQGIDLVSKSKDIDELNNIIVELSQEISQSNSYIASAILQTKIRERNNLIEMLDSEVQAKIASIALKVVYDENNVQQIYIDDMIIEDKLLHTENISKTTPLVAHIGSNRERVRQIQRGLAQTENIVMEGRDIGTEVLPNADIKLFIYASPEARAKRRVLQLAQSGEIADYDNVLEDIKKRDSQDINRPISPLKRADDATTINNAGKDFPDMCKYISNLVRCKIVNLSKKDSSGENALNPSGLVL